MSQIKPKLILIFNIEYSTTPALLILVRKKLLTLYLYHVPIARSRCYPGSNALCLLQISTIHIIFLSDVDRNHVVPLPAAVSTTRSTVA